MEETECKHVHFPLGEIGGPFLPSHLGFQLQQELIIFHSY